MTQNSPDWQHQLQDTALCADHFDEASQQRIRQWRQAALDGIGLSGCTTVMIGHIPRRCKPIQLLDEVHRAGFWGLYDYYYLPMDQRGRLTNRRIAFVNLVSTEVAERFYRSFHRGTLKGFEDEQALFVMPADLQGFEANAARWEQSTLDERRLGCRPLFLHYPQAQQALADMGELYGPQCIRQLLEPEHHDAKGSNGKGSNGSRDHSAAEVQSTGQCASTGRFGNSHERAINGDSHLDLSPEMQMLVAQSAVWRRTSFSV